MTICIECNGHYDAEASWLCTSNRTVQRGRSAVFTFLIIGVLFSVDCISRKGEGTG